MKSIKIRRALLSVSDKSGLIALAQTLCRHGIELLSTGGTYRTLREAGLSVKEVSEHTGFPEMLDGRVKTLHPKVHGGILYRRDLPEHRTACEEHGIEPIDMVVVNLYPFEATVAKADVSREEAIENIDIGGPSMIRSAAKNHEHVAVITDPSQYATVIEHLDQHDGSLPTPLLRDFAWAAFERTSRYDAAIHSFFSRSKPSEDATLFPSDLRLYFKRDAVLRYGENPHQQGAFYIDEAYQPASLARATKRHGKELSYNNLLDLDSALAIVREFDRPAAAIIKHNNPCGASLADRLVDAFEKAYAGDPVSAFGSVIAFNKTVDESTAMLLTEPNRFVEAIVAPAFDEAALELLTTRPTWKTSVRLLEVGDLRAHADLRGRTPIFRSLEGGLLVQTPDVGESGWQNRSLVTHTSPTEAQLADLYFGWIIVKHVRSNAIVLAKNEAILGVGAGQMSRVDSVNIAIEKAGKHAEGAVLASDAFFPFRDNVDLSAAAGIKAIVQPGGSKRDQDSITACDEFGIAMLFTGQRHFKH
ncbi:bifunctional phosphoribosylaminoimidazolecarboxamide formyltransferase/IMP cyclohydrolase [bacterium]|nr:bifunctional phosphoribosylaminoimidazolecarboxamide formyltransferase/IMP cyclohydrolase [bacterium]